MITKCGILEPPKATDKKAAVVTIAQLVVTSNLVRQVFARSISAR